MTHYLISFHDGDMDHLTQDELPAVSAAALEVRRAATAAGVWVWSSGLLHQVPSVVSTTGMVTDGPYPETKEHLGGFAVVDVATRAEAIEWAKLIAVACRCAQEVFELLPQPQEQPGVDAT